MNVIIELLQPSAVSLSPFLPSAAQDAGLDALAAVISRQKTMGQDIGNELDEQNGEFYLKMQISKI